MDVTAVHNVRKIGTVSYYKYCKGYNKTKESTLYSYSQVTSKTGYYHSKSINNKKL